MVKTRDQEMTKGKLTLLIFLFVAIVLATAVFTYGQRAQTTAPLVQIYHLPKYFSRRYGDFTANVSGSLARQVRQVQYRLNDDQWLDLRQGHPRVPPPLFTIEIENDKLRPGTNHLMIKALSDWRKPEITTLQFEYDPTPISLPLTVDWRTADLDVQDGFWETFSTPDGYRVRPKPGFEDYDRLIVVAGAFPGGRRIETDLVFRRSMTRSKPFGFGVLPLWGGHPDGASIRPRRGWNFSLVWFYSRYNGVGMEFSYKYGNAQPDWISSYRNLTLAANVRYFLAVEAWPELDAAGAHKRYRQRMQWWTEGEPPPHEWIELTDAEGAPIPPGEYAVALNAHRSQVDFGPVVIKPR